MFRLCLVIFLLYNKLFYSLCFLVSHNKMSHSRLCKLDNNISASTPLENDKDPSAKGKLGYPKNIIKEYLLLSFRLRDDVSLLPNNKRAIRSIFSKHFRIGLERDGTIRCSRSDIMFYSWKFYSCDRSMKVEFYLPELGYKGLIRARRYYVFHSLDGMVPLDVYLIINGRTFNIASLYFTTPKLKKYKSASPNSSYYTFFCDGRLLNEWDNRIKTYITSLYGRYSIRINSFPTVYHIVPIQDISVYIRMVMNKFDILPRLPEYRFMRVEVGHRCISNFNTLIPSLCFLDIYSGFIFPRIHSLYQSLFYCLSLSYMKVIGDLHVASLSL